MIQRFFLLGCLFWSAFATSLTSVNLGQQEIDAAYSLLLETTIGQSICSGILGANAHFIQFHWGVSEEAAQKFAQRCSSGPVAPAKYVYPTQPADIHKPALTLKRPRTYQFLITHLSYPIESWTDPFTNTTYIVGDVPSPIRLVQILAHETGVYFDSKANLAGLESEAIPELRKLQISSPPGVLNPKLAVSDPLQAHTLTYVRAMQIETQVLLELAKLHPELGADGLVDKDARYLSSKACGQECLTKLVIQLRAIYKPMTLPILALAPDFRERAVASLPQWYGGADTESFQKALLVLHDLPEKFLKTRYSGNILSDLNGVLLGVSEDAFIYDMASQFMEHELWPKESPLLFNSETNFGVSLLMYLKEPLLSGYNIGLASGPRVRVRTGIAE